VRGRREAGCDRRAGAAARAAGDPRGVPGIARRAERERLRRAQRLQLRHVRLAEDHHPGGAQPRDDLGIVLRRAAVAERAVRGDLPGDVGVVLDRDRDAVERRRIRPAPAVGRVGGNERLLGHDDPVRADLRVQARDPVQVQLGQLTGGHLTVGDERGLADEPGEGEVGGVHGARP
jgi:hypothetical protein